MSGRVARRVVDTFGRTRRRGQVRECGSSPKGNGVITPARNVQSGSYQRYTTSVQSTKFENFESRHHGRAVPSQRRTASPPRSWLYKQENPSLKTTAAPIASYDISRELKTSFTLSVPEVAVPEVAVPEVAYVDVAKPVHIQRTERYERADRDEQYKGQHQEQGKNRKQQQQQQEQEEEGSNRHSWFFRGARRVRPSKTLALALASAPIVMLASDERDPKYWKDSADYVDSMKAVGGSSEQLEFTKAGRFLLGLGYMGIFASNSSPDAPLKRKLFENINDLFDFHSNKNDSTARASEWQKSKTGESACPGHKCFSPNMGQENQADRENSKKPAHPFQRLVKGDRLVLKEGDITKEHWKALSKFLVSCPHINSLRIQGVEITCVDADELGPGLRRIRHITFCDNSIGLNAGTLEKLVAVLLTCGMLESTSIVRNSITDSHVPHLVTLLKEHGSISQMSLSWNSIGNLGATKLSEILKHRIPLDTMDLSYNQIGDAGAKKLLMAVKHRNQSAKRRQDRAKHGTSSKKRTVTAFPRLKIELRNNRTSARLCRDFPELRAPRSWQEHEPWRRNDQPPPS